MNLIVFCIFIFCFTFVVFGVKLIWHVLGIAWLFISMGIKIIKAKFDEKQTEKILNTKDNEFEEHINDLNEKTIIICPELENKMKWLKLNFPHANEELLNKYYNQYSSLSFIKAKELEDDIINSHYKNLNLANINYVKPCTMEDIENGTLIDTVFQYPFSFEFIKVNENYVLKIKDFRDSTLTAIQSKSHTSLLRCTNEIVNNILLIKHSENNRIPTNIQQLYKFQNYVDLMKINL